MEIGMETVVGIMLDRLNQMEEFCKKSLQILDTIKESHYSLGLQKQHRISKNFTDMDTFLYLGRIFFCEELLSQVEKDSQYFEKNGVDKILIVRWKSGIADMWQIIFTAMLSRLGGNLILHALGQEKIDCSKVLNRISDMEDTQTSDVLLLAEDMREFIKDIKNKNKE